METKAGAQEMAYSAIRFNRFKLRWLAQPALADGGSPTCSNNARDANVGEGDEARTKPEAARSARRCQSEARELVEFQQCP
jgi:hypothetical protein